MAEPSEHGTENGTASGAGARPAGDVPQPSADPAQRPTPGEPAGPPAERTLRSAERERDAAETSRDRFAFLAEVSRVLAESLATRPR